MGKKSYRFKFLILFALAMFFVSIAPDFCFASREDVVLSPDYQIES